MASLAERFAHRAGLPDIRRAAGDTVLRAGDPGGALWILVAGTLRLAFVATYLADLKNRYGDAPGPTRVSVVLQQLANRQVVRARPGSARGPDPDR